MCFVAKKNFICMSKGLISFAILTNLKKVLLYDSSTYKMIKLHQNFAELSYYVHNNACNLMYLCMSFMWYDRN